MKWFTKIKDEAGELSQKLATINEQEAVVEEDKKTLKTVKKTPTIDLLGQDVERKTPVFQPPTYGAIKPVVDELMEQKMVLVDFSKLPAAERIRTIDFISGVMYGLNGEYKKIEHHVYKFIVRK